MDTIDAIPHLFHDLPEAPCSVNAFLDLPKVGRTQITGRGYTGDEAAENFAETLSAMQARYCAKPAPTLGRLLDKWLAQIGDSTEKIDLIERIMLAFTMVATGRVARVPETAHGLYVVGIEFPTHVSLAPDGGAGACECSEDDDHCVHTLAAQIYHRVHQEEGS